MSPTGVEALLSANSTRSGPERAWPRRWTRGRRATRLRLCKTTAARTCCSSRASRAARDRGAASPNGLSCDMRRPKRLLASMRGRSDPCRRLIDLRGPSSCDGGGVAGATTRPRTAGRRAGCSCRPHRATSQIPGRRRKRTRYPLQDVVSADVVTGCHALYLRAGEQEGSDSSSDSMNSSSGSAAGPSSGPILRRFCRSWIHYDVRMDGPEVSCRHPRALSRPSSLCHGRRG